MKTKNKILWDSAKSVQKVYGGKCLHLKITNEQSNLSPKGTTTKNF